jgi:hypothetical protein
MHRCPECGSGNIHRSRAKTTWDIWRQKLTGKRPHRCRKCDWRGWAVDGGSGHAGKRSVVPDPPNLANLGLARHDSRNELDLDALDALISSAGERS